MYIIMTILRMEVVRSERYNLKFTIIYFPKDWICFAVHTRTHGFLDECFFIEIDGTVRLCIYLSGWIFSVLTDIWTSERYLTETKISKAFPYEQRNCVCSNIFSQKIVDQVCDARGLDGKLRLVLPLNV